MIERKLQATRCACLVFGRRRHPQPSERSQLASLWSHLAPSGAGSYNLGMLSMDSRHILIALLPLALYLLRLGWVNYRARPTLVTGTRDTLSLALAISGLVAIGPMELFMPQAAARRFDSFIWILLFAFYLLCTTLITMLIRPRLIIYNSTIDHVRPLLARCALELDREASWASDSLALPQLQVQLHLESTPALGYVQIVSTGPRQSFPGWRKIEQALRRELQPIRSPRNPQALALFIIASLLFSVVVLALVRDPSPLAPLRRASAQSAASSARMGNN